MTVNRIALGRSWGCFVRPIEIEKYAPAARWHSPVVASYEAP